MAPVMLAALKKFLFHLITSTLSTNSAKYVAAAKKTEINWTVVNVVLGIRKMKPFDITNSSVRPTQPSIPLELVNG